MILFFDTETTGLPRDWKAPMTQLDNWPRVIQLAWTVADMDGTEIRRTEHLIKPDGWIVPAEPFWIEHGFTTQACMSLGAPLPDVLDLFTRDLATCEILVSHNMDFDHKVLGAEMLRYGVQGKRCLKICTKEASVDFCKIPFGGQRAYLSKMGRYKWPKLDELHTVLFGKKFDDAHSAGGDVIALKNCFFELVRLGIIQLPEPQTPKP